MARSLTPCSHPNCPNVCSGSRCAQHGGTARPYRGSSAAQGYDAAWRRARAAAIAAHLERHGPVCPGWRRPPHRVDPAALTGDHIQPLALGGARLDPANIGVLCGPCNSAKRDTPPRG